MSKLLVETNKEEKIIVDFLLTPSEIHKILEENGEIQYLARGVDSDVFKIGDDVLKVYCLSGIIDENVQKIKFETLERYKELTDETKDLLENNPPEKFKKFVSKNKEFNIFYNVVPINKIYSDVGDNIRIVINDLFPKDYISGRFLETDDPSTALLQSFIPGLPFKKDSELLEQPINELEKKGISFDEFRLFLDEVWDSFPDYGLIHFGFCPSNVRANVEDNNIEIIITDLASKVFQQVKYFEKGKKYTQEEIAKLMGVD